MFCLIKNKARFLQNSKQKIYYQIKIVLFFPCMLGLSNFELKIKKPEAQTTSNKN